MMTLTILSPEKQFTDKLSVRKVIVPGVQGQCCLLSGHTDFVSQMESGKLVYELENKKVETISVGQGFFQIFSNEVVVLTESVS